MQWLCVMGILLGGKSEHFDCQFQYGLKLRGSGHYYLFCPETMPRLFLTEGKKIK